MGGEEHARGETYEGQSVVGEYMLTRKTIRRGTTLPDGARTYDQNPYLRDERTS